MKKVKQFLCKLGWHYWDTTYGWKWAQCKWCDEWID